MKLKAQLRFVTLATFAFVAAAVVGGLVVTASQPATESGGVHAAWISTAETIAEQTQQADLVARVQVIGRAEPRFLWSPTPDGAERTDGQSTFAFTDSEVEILEVYSGKAEIGDRLWTLQTGGDLLTKSGELARLEIAEDPLYKAGEEMILFLVDISDDPVHAGGRSLYRTVNPAGRFLVEGGLASRVLLTHPTKSAEQLDLATLEQQISSASQK